MVLQSDMMYPAVGYKHQHNYSHEEEDHYSQNSYNYSSMQMMRPKPANPNTNYMMSSPQPSQCHVAVAPGGGYSGGHYDHLNKDKYHGGKDKFYEEFSVKEKHEKYQDAYGGHYDNHNKEKYEKYQDGYGGHFNKDKYCENKEKFNEGLFKAEKHHDGGYGHYDNKERFNSEGFKLKEKYQDGYGNYESHEKDGYGHKFNEGKYREGYGHNKFSMDKMVSGGYGNETHFVAPHMRRPMATPYEKMMDSWEFKGIDD